MTVEVYSTGNVMAHWRSSGYGWIDDRGVECQRQKERIDTLVDTAVKARAWYPAWASASESAVRDGKTKIKKKPIFSFVIPFESGSVPDHLWTPYAASEISRELERQLNNENGGHTFSVVVRWDAERRMFDVRMIAWQTK